MLNRTVYAHILLLTLSTSTIIASLGIYYARDMYKIYSNVEES